MAACAPSFSSCDVVPQQCYRRTAEESPAVSAPLSTRTTFSTDLRQKKERQKESIAASNPGNYQIKTKSHFESGLDQTSNWDRLHSVARRSTGHPVHLTCFQRHASL